MLWAFKEGEHVAGRAMEGAGETGGWEGGWGILGAEPPRRWGQEGKLGADWQGDVREREGGGEGRKETDGWID